MSKKYLIIFENTDGDVFKKVYVGFTSQKDAIEYFKENNTKYGCKIIAIRTLTSNNIYL